MDALSELLRVVRLTGGVFLEASFTAPWCISARIGPEDCRHVLTEPASVVAFHYVLDGRMLVQVDGAAPLEVAAGAVVLLPRNDVHTLTSEKGLSAVDAGVLVQMQHEGALAHIDHGGGGALTRIVCGFVGSETRRHPLLDALPQFLLLDLNGRPESEWVASSFRFAAQEVAAARAGSETVLARLSELLFIEAVRDYLAALPPAQKGWLAGLRDPAIGRALALMHARLADPWTAEQLAAEALLSRSAFAERFTTLVGVPPMSYLTAWRMQVAAQSLRETRRSVAQVAEAVGYESEAAFARAFKREMGVSPGEYRRRG
jgi:AraC-like DNA-binding protein